jgi:hypothetical protein
MPVIARPYDIVKTPKIASVKPLDGLRLLVGFSNGVQKLYDCAPLMNRPQFGLLAEPGFFRNVRVDAGGYGISWTDDLDLSEYELWTNGQVIANDTTQADGSASRCAED